VPRVNNEQRHPEIPNIEIDGGLGIDARDALGNTGLLVPINFEDVNVS
jgi:hypothetical protein